MSQEIAYDHSRAGSVSSDSLREAVVANRVWYHTIELRPGLVTPGWFDLRPIVNRLPWPELRGKRCLDVGTYDGFLAFELERRGAAEVVATDISDHNEWDWLPESRALGPSKLAEMAGPKGRGFEIARDALGSAVKRELISVYDLSPERVGTFDVVICGALLLHLRDPMRALEAIRSVCEEAFMSSEEIRLGLSVVHPRLPLANLATDPQLVQWMVPNAAGHRQMVHAAGFSIERTARPFCVAFGIGHPPRGRSLASIRRQGTRLLLTGRTGPPYSALLARPRV